MEELLGNISSKDLEKLKMLFSLIPGYEQKEVVTLRVFINEYSNLIKQNRSNAYHVSVMSSFKHILEFFCAQKSIREIGLNETENFCSYLQQKVLNGHRVYYRTLKAAFNKAKDWGYVTENYFTKVKLPKRQKLAPVFINSDQLSAICGQIKNVVIKNVFVFAFYTGMRLDEIINLRWKNANIENRIITVGDENFTTKGRKQRFIPISEEALEALLRMKNAECRIANGNIKIRVVKLVGDASATLSMTDHYVFCKADGTKYTGDHVSQSFKRACKAVGFDNAIHFHSLRHSFASNLVQKGVPLYTIKELLGHSSISTTEIYSHLNLETLREAIARFDVRSSKGKEIDNAKNDLKIFRINSMEK